jgi:hypothetical protein
MLPVSLEYPFLISPSGFSLVYFVSFANETDKEIQLILKRLKTPNRINRVNMKPTENTDDFPFGFLIGLFTRVSVVRSIVVINFLFCVSIML